MNDARGFYAIISVSVLAGLGIQYSPISPMKALFWSAVINGLVAVPLMVVIIILVSKSMRPGIPSCVTKPVATCAAAAPQSHSPAASAGA